MRLARHNGDQLTAQLLSLAAQCGIKLHRAEAAIRQQHLIFLVRVGLKTLRVASYLPGRRVDDEVPNRRSPREYYRLRSRARRKLAVDQIEELQPGDYP